MINFKNMFKYTIDDRLSNGTKVLMNIFVLKSSHIKRNTFSFYYANLQCIMGNISEKQIQRYVKELVDNGYIKVENNKRSGVPTTFTLLFNDDECEDYKERSTILYRDRNKK